ncbi:copper resistance CopC family protein [Arthrobacter sp. B3I4]|uniref:copper resistance CopC family protein n=1 Tax=Arthrobacter sp. B3I4 TaxID=3042267 RepID=UPI002780DF41|nr:copper resistance CopC family protein [Arthrobacter sp. B3I4]MDQ0754453.1 methionine-rich copper-binding protein CopC [Arthrobacter sp. B3I4]
MRFVQRLPGALLGLILLAAVLLGVPLAGAGPASAHDAVESTSPSNGATVPAVPETVSLTLTNRPLALGSQIKVSDAAGTNWADGAVQILDNVASQRLKAGAPAGLFTVQWRLASSDGHPIEGTFSFTATAGASSTAGTGSPAAAAPASGAASATVPTMGTAAPGTTTAPSPVADASQPFPWSIVIFVAVAVGILVALALVAKRRLDAGDGDSAP